VNIAVIGTGNAGTAHAALLTLAGHDVILLKTTPAASENYDAIQAAGGITLTEGGTETFVRVGITRDPSEALNRAAAAIVMTTTNAHANVAKLISPHAQHLQALALIPGYMGTTIFRRALPEGVLLIEGESTPADARVEAPGRVRVLYRNARNPVAANPASRNQEALTFMRTLFPTYDRTRANVIDSALHNPNVIVHTIGAIMSAARIEHSLGEFWMYREAFTPSTWRLVTALDREKMRVLSAYGCEPVSYLQAAHYRIARDAALTLEESFATYASDGSPKGPTHADSRYVTEDVPMGLGLLASLARNAAIETPTTDALITIAGALLDRDFHAETRTLERLGVPGGAEATLASIT